VFLQDVTGKRHLRLDYGYNVKTGRVEYHWNQKGVHKTFGIANHASEGKGGGALYEGARFYKHAGRAILFLGAAIDIHSIVVAKRRYRQVTVVAAGWSGAWGGCKLGGAVGAAGGTLVAPGIGTAILGGLGCIGGGIAGYEGAAHLAGVSWDWVEETWFESVPSEPWTAELPAEDVP
jgi:hypothetical protein